MGSTDEFQTWLASNPIDLDVEQMNDEHIIKNEHSEMYLNDSTETEEDTNVKTGSMIKWMFEEDTTQISVIPDIKEKKRGRKKRKMDVLVLICGWKFCSLTFNDWSEMHEHITVQHLGEVRSLLVGQEEVGCRWQGCGYGSQLVSGYRRHLNVHCYQVSWGRGFN